MTLSNRLTNDYLNFDLLITRAGEGYRAYVVDAPGGDASVAFDLPAAALDRGRLVHGDGTRRGVRLISGPATPPPPSLREQGGLLFETIFREGVRSVLIASQSEAQAAGRDLRIRLRFSEDAVQLATLPWEILFDAEQQHFLALSTARPILRYLSLPRPRPALVVQPPLSILAVLASPTDHHALNIDQEWQAIEAALADLRANDKIRLERLATPTFDALRARLLGEPVHVLHFIGHGVYNVGEGEGQLLFEDSRGKGHLVPAKAMAMLLHNHPSLRLAYLNACEGAIADHGNVFAGVAQTLVQQGVPAAVAMQDEISDDAAIEMARTFYTALATGRPVDAALSHARVALATRDNDEWAIPVLFSRSPDNRLFDVVEVLPTPICPYPGMRPFTTEQADKFFGRDREIADAVNRLAQHPFLTVIGPSGSGKSSLAYAGLIPALRKAGRFGDGEWTVKLMRPSDSRTADGKAAPMQALSQLLDLAPQSRITNLHSPTLLFIDQFEELFTLADAGEAAHFLKALHTLMQTPNLYILLTVRADFYPELMAMGPLWEAVKANRLELTPLGDDELWAAIVQPAAAVGVTVDEALVVELIHDAAGEAGVLPLVQETLVLLWEKVASRQLKLKAYQAMADGGRSGIQVAIDRRASVIYNNLPAAAQPIAHRIFLRLIQFGEGRADTRRQQTVTELRAGGDDPVSFAETLRTLTDSRLLTTSGEEGDPNRRVDISHEALIGGWALLQTWIGEKRVAESTRRRLEDKVTEWLRLERNGGLLDEYEAQEADSWLKSDYCQDLGYSQNLIDLIAASKTALAEAKAEKVEAERTRQRSQLFAAGLMLAVVVIGLVAWFWWEARESEKVAIIAKGEAEISAQEAKDAFAIAETERETAIGAKEEADSLRIQANEARDEATTARENAEQQRRATLANQLAADSIISLEMDNLVDRALLLSVEALSRTWETDAIRVTAAEEALHQSLSASLTDPIRLYERNLDVLSVAFSLDGKLLGLFKDYTVEVWSLDQVASRETSPITYTEILQPEQFLPSAYVQTKGKSLRSPDGNWQATTSGKFISLENIQNSGAISVLFGHEDPVWGMLFTPDSKQLISGSEDYTVRIWTLADPDAKPTVLRGHTGAISALALNADGSRLATGSTDSTVRIWDLSKPTDPPVILRDHTLGIQDLTYSPDGKWLAAVSRSGTVNVWRDDVDLLVEAACRTVSRNLTAQEWQQSLGELPYRKTCSRIPYAEIAGQYPNVKIIDTFLVVGRELNKDGWQLLQDTGLYNLLFIPDQVYNGPSLDELPSLSTMERESLERNLTRFGQSNRLIGKTSFLWERPELFAVPLPPPETELIAIDPTFSIAERRLAELWNSNGSLFAAIAAEIGVDLDVVVAVYSVESANPLDNERLLIRFENHLFYDEWGLENEELFSHYFSFSQEAPWQEHMWRPDKNQEWQMLHLGQASEWEAFNFARSLDETAALRSISMGAPQILGRNHARLGFSTAQEMFDVFLSPNAQDRINIFTLFDFVRSSELLSMLQERDLVAFTSGYNGPGQANHYTSLIEAQVDSFNAVRPPGVAASSSAVIQSTAQPVVPPTSEHKISLHKPFIGHYAITQKFGENPHYYAQFRYSGVPLKGHPGLNFGIPMGTTILAVDDGFVKTIDTDFLDGSYILIQHEWGESFYNNIEFSDVGIGDEVRRGGKIGVTGNSGASTGPHLSFRIRIDPYDRADGFGGFSDPLPYFEFEEALALVEQAHNLARWEGDVEGAIAKFEEALALDPSLEIEPEQEAKQLAAQALVEQARELARNEGDVAGAIAKFEEALALDPSLEIEPEQEAKQLAAQAVEQARELARNEGDVAGAIAKFEEALALDPSLEIEPEQEAKQLAAQALVAQAHDFARWEGDVESAIAKFEEALALDPSLEIEPEQEAKQLAAQALVEQAHNLARWEGDVESAIAKFEEALALDPSLEIEPEQEAKQLAAQALVAQARELARNEGDVAGAIAKFEEALALDLSLEIEPEQEAQHQAAKFFVDQGRNLALDGNVEQATTKFEEAILLDPLLEIEPARFAQQISAIAQPTVSAEGLNILDTMSETDEFRLMFNALEAAGLQNILGAAGPLTIFVPTDDAFSSLPPGQYDNLLKSPGVDLADMMLFHIIPNRITKSDMGALGGATTLQGGNIEFNITESGVTINGETNVIRFDIETANGVIHVIDKVLQPE